MQVDMQADAFRIVRENPDQILVFRAEGSWMWCQQVERRPGEQVGEDWPENCGDTIVMTRVLEPGQDAADAASDAVRWRLGMKPGDQPRIVVQP